MVGQSPVDLVVFFLALAFLLFALFFYFGLKYLLRLFTRPSGESVESVSGDTFDDDLNTQAEWKANDDG